MKLSFQTKFFLDQNYPNPFNPSTKFRYSIPNASKVIIKVFNVLGREIETLVNEEKPTGTYELNWNAANLPSGVYFYQIASWRFCADKKNDFTEVIRIPSSSSPLRKGRSGQG